MSKKIIKGKSIHIALNMIGSYENEDPIIHDTDKNEKIDPREIESKIKIYEREVMGWFINPAKDLLEDNPMANSFLVIMVCMSYIEGVEQYKSGRSSANRSRECFIDSLKKIYPNKFSNDELQRLYDKSRCGLFHNGMVKEGVIFNNDDFPEPLAFDENEEYIKINPTLLLADLEKDFNSYLQKLRESLTHHDNNELQNLRNNFDTMFNVI